MNNNKTCPNCGGNLVLKKGISQKTGQPYAFWGCTNFKEMGCSYTERIAPQRIAPTPSIPTPVGLQQAINGLGLIRGDIKRLEEKIDAIKKIVDRFSNQDKIVIYPETEAPEEPNLFEGETDTDEEL